VVVSGALDPKLEMLILLRHKFLLCFLHDYRVEQAVDFGLQDGHKVLRVNKTRVKLLSAQFEAELLAKSAYLRQVRLRDRLFKLKSDSDKLVNCRDVIIDLLAVQLDLIRVLDALLH